MIVTDDVVQEVLEEEEVVLEVLDGGGNQETKVVHQLIMIAVSMTLSVINKEGCMMNQLDHSGIFLLLIFFFYSRSFIVCRLFIIDTVSFFQHDSLRTCAFIFWIFHIKRW